MKEEWLSESPFKKWRSERNISAATAASECGVSPQLYRAWELGISVPSMKYWNQAFKITNIDINEIKAWKSRKPYEEPKPKKEKKVKDVGGEGESGQQEGETSGGESQEVIRESGESSTREDNGNAAEIREDSKSSE